MSKLWGFVNVLFKNDHGIAHQQKPQRPAKQKRRINILPSTRTSVAKPDVRAGELKI
jgi:hypothetical protein